MLNKRLLIVLIVFISLATVATIGGTVFVVRGINIRFTNTLEYLETDEAQILSDLENDLSFTRGRSTIFGINRSRIRRTIEQNQPRIIVTNIEVFPTRLEIRVRERYPVFEFIEQGGGRIVMDRDMRFVTRSQILTRSLIDITGQINPTSNISLEYGDPFDYLFPSDPYGNRPEYAEGYLARIDRLRLTTIVFWELALREDGITHLLNAVNFVQPQDSVIPGGRFDMLLSFRRLNSLDTASDTSLHLMGVEYDNAFREMLRFTWDVKTHYQHMPVGRYRTYIDSANCIHVVVPTLPATSHRCCDNIIPRR